MEKINEGDKPNGILDVVGATIIAKDMRSLVDIVRDMRQRGEVVRIKDRYKTPDRSGYRDILTNVRASNGFIGEIQVNVEQMLDAKEKRGGHTLYEAIRELPNDVKEKLLTEEEAKTDNDILLNISNEFYADAYDAVLNEDNASASSRSIEELLYQMANGSIREGASFLSGRTLNKIEESLFSVATGLSSKSQNSRSGSSQSGTGTSGALSNNLLGNESTKSSNTSVPSNESIVQDEEKGKPLFQTKSNPVEDLISRAGAMLADLGERERVVGELRELEKLYPPDANEYQAPNGRPSNLSPEAWYAVRTPSFKKWFGDWEVETTVEWLLQTDAVAGITGEEFKKSEIDLVTQVETFFNSIGGKVNRAGIGDVILNKEGAKSSIGHKLGRKKAAAFAAIPEIIQHGRIVDHQWNWKGRGYETYVIDAPISIGGSPYIGEVVLTRRSGSAKFYLHEVETQEKLRSGASFQAGTESGTPLGASKLIIAQKLEEVKGKVSQVRDANGEPLPVYHGTHSAFDVFDRDKGDLNDAGWSGEGHYFYEDKNEASQYAQRGGHIMAEFLNVREPYYLSDEERNELVERDDREYSREFADQVKSDGYDGVYYNGDLRKEWTVFDSAQIKSATDNAGTYSGENPSILFQFSNDQILEEGRRFDSWQEWKAYVEAMEAGDDYALRPEGDSAETDAWYKETWEKARGITRDEKGQVVEEKPVLSGEERKTLFLDTVNENLDRFLTVMREEVAAGNIDPDFRPDDEAEALEMEEAEARARRIRSLVHPQILANATRVAKGKPLTESSRRAVMTHIENGWSHYAALYGELMGDERIAAMAEEEAQTLPEIKDPKGKPLSIVQKTAIAKTIKDGEIRRKYEAGTLTETETLEYIGVLTEDKKNLESRLRAAEKEIEEDNSRLSRGERAYAKQREEISALEKAIKSDERELKRLEDSLAKAKAREKSVRTAKNEKIKGLEDTVKSTRAKARENKKTLTEAYEQQIDKIRDQLRASRETLQSARREAALEGATQRAKAALAKREALEELRMQIRYKEKEARAAAKIIEEKKLLIAQIMKPLPKKNSRIWYKQAEQIRAIQSYLDPKARAAVIKWNEQSFDIETFRNKILNENILDDILPPGLAQRIFSKPLADWEPRDLEELRDEINNLKAQGKAEWARLIALRNAKRNRDRAQADRQAVGFNEEYAKADTKEKRDRLAKKDGTIPSHVRNFMHNLTRTLFRVADWMDGGKPGIYTKLLVTEEREAYRAQEQNKYRRMKPVLDYMKEKGIDETKLYEERGNIPGFAPDAINDPHTLSDLLYLYIGLRDQKTREAIEYGNLMDAVERAAWKREVGIIEATEGKALNKLQRQQAVEAAGAKFIAAQEAKVKALEEYIQNELTADEKGLADLIGNDFRDEFGRLNDVLANEFNRRMEQINSYVPMFRKDATGTNAKEEQQARQILEVNGTAISTNPEKGFSVNRINIMPYNQLAISLDLFGTWLKAVDAQEHFVAYTGYIRELNSIFKGKTSQSAQLQQHIRQVYGGEILKRIQEEISAFSNPQSFKDNQNINKILRLLRGNLAAAYLAWKTSGIIKQLITSPAPFFAHVNPAQYFASAWEYMSNHEEFNNLVREKSAFMRNRTLPLVEAVRQAQKDGKFQRKWAKFQDIGMKGLEWADWSTVSIGWNAVYKKALNEGLSEQEAIARADDVVIKTQPSSRDADIAPLFKEKSEAMRTFLQFQTALNVIWNQITYDLPAAIKNRQFGYVTRMVMSYAVAGTVLGLVTQGLGDDDDEEKRLKHGIFYATTQFTDAVPIFGGDITNLVEQLITGDKKRSFQDSPFPAVQKIFNAVRDLGQADLEKAASDFGNGVAMFIGAPASGAKEAGRVFGIGDEDGELDFNPEAFLGRRK
ncbi:MAG: hypothetical protein LBQ57_05655 [Spirochaetales bacterium]|jgi:hypothetical protein|nr:hypothetical protein [Spirochaetales bacterium]